MDTDPRNTDAQLLIKFLEDMPNDVKEFPKTRFSTTSKTFVKKLFRNIGDADKQWTQVNTVIDYEPIDFDKGHSSWWGKDPSYLDPSIKREIENMDKVGIVYSFSIGSGNRVREVSVTLVGSPQRNKENPTLFEDIIKKVYLWTHVAFLYAPEHCSQNLCIYLYLTDLKKTLPTKRGEPITQMHANTAFTTACQKETDIYVFRYEEWFKVLIHETFHCLGLDFSHIDNARTRDAILKLFPVNSEVNLSETYCEVWAELFNTLFVVFSQNNGSHGISNMENMIAQTEDYLDMERLFSLFQSCKVLHFFDVPYEDLFHKEGDTMEKKEARKSKFREQTNVLSYYIIKCILLFSIDDFLLWCHAHNRPAYSIQFNTSRLDNYCGLVEALHLRREFLQAKERMGRLVAEGGVRGYAMRTLRMTVVE